MEHQILGNCQCGDKFRKINRGYKCLGCEHIVWEQFMNKTLNVTQVKKLFKGGSVKLKNLKSRAGNVFNAEIFYNDKELSLEYL